MVPVVVMPVFVGWVGWACWSSQDVKTCGRETKNVHDQADGARTGGEVERRRPTTGFSFLPSGRKCRHVAIALPSTNLSMCRSLD